MLQWSPISSWSIQLIINTLPVWLLRHPSGLFHWCKTINCKLASSFCSAICLCNSRALPVFSKHHHSRSLILLTRWRHGLHWRGFTFKSLFGDVERPHGIRTGVDIAIRIQLQPTEVDIGWAGAVDCVVSCFGAGRDMLQWLAMNLWSDLQSGLSRTAWTSRWVTLRHYPSCGFALIHCNINEVTSPERESTRRVSVKNR